MTLLPRLLGEVDKAEVLQGACDHLRRGEADSHLFDVNPEAFGQVPGAPFAYWVSERVRGTFRRLPGFEKNGREAQHS